VPTPTEGIFGYTTAYDAKRHRALVFGGRTASGGTGQQMTNVVREYDLSAKTWTEVAASPSSLPIRLTGAFAYHPKLERTVLFGGYQNGFIQLGDTWEYDGATWTEKMLVPPAAPPPQFYAQLERALRDGGPPPVDPADAIATLEVIEAARVADADKRVLPVQATLTERSRR